MKNVFLLAVAAAFAMPQFAQADLILGIDQFRSANPGDPLNYAVQDGVDAFTTRSGTDSSGASATPGVNAAGSTDGSIGTVFDPAVSTGTSDAGESWRWVNGAQTATFDFAFTDTSGVDRVLSTFHFDAGATRPNVAREWELFLVDGGETSLGTGTAPSAGAGTPIYGSFDVSLSNLAFDANSTVNLSLRFTRDNTSTNTSGHHGFLDNVGLSTVAVPEPSSLALLGVAGVCGMVRRRKK